MSSDCAIPLQPILVLPTQPRTNDNVNLAPSDTIVPRKRGMHEDQLQSALRDEAANSVMSVRARQAQPRPRLERQSVAAGQL